MKHIQWIVLDKCVSTQESSFYKSTVPHYGQVIDIDKSFYDTISILRHVDGIVSTDTSLPHLALSLRIKNICALNIWVRMEMDKRQNNTMVSRSCFSQTKTIWRLE